jgi:hypothetical protein
VVPAVVGAVVGLATIVRAEAMDRSITMIAVAYIAGQVMLAAVVAVLSVVLHEIGRTGPIAWPFAVLGAAAGLSAIGIGMVGRQGLRALGAADERSARSVASRELRHVVPFQLIGVVSCGVAIVLVITPGR